MSREKIQRPSAPEVAAWIKGLGIKEGSEVFIRSDFVQHDGFQSYIVAGGYYDGVTANGRVRLYVPGNSFSGRGEKRSTIPSKTIYSIEKPKPIDWSEVEPPRMYFGPL